ncbi:FabD/lysophospholipase-like protein [Myriangium duriaei CBS 260.36]|uniref:FabD/lysophospholipase-like protein n=1 Tax=Myriangium duriaei CBS 260.36 TaxID=1168546 RepID=A0A9P4J8S2_9PEZI|nr:FabD/lysophospholipase-like protein [Myriangium duriaei CBS 260.36]
MSHSPTPAPSIISSINTPRDQFREWVCDVKEPWDPCILALDGGGIRGFSSALILKELMHQIYLQEHELEAEEPTGDIPQSEDDLLPCHYFDFMYGTSTGGLIAVMLARLRMSIGECLQQYRLVGDKLFGHRRTIIPFMTKYRSEPLVKAVKELRNDSMLAGPAQWDEPEQPPWDPNEPRVCQSCCLTAIHNGSVQKAHLLRSYPHSYRPERMQSFATAYNNGADDLEIWQVTRATSAAPFYFDMLEAVVEGEMRGHKDGGIRENNPAVAAWDEYASMYHPNMAPALLLSIGTGRTNTPPDGFMSALPWPWGHIKIFRKIAENISVIPNLLVKYTESEGKHTEMLRYAKGENTWYKRLNVSSGMDNMSLDSWVRGDYQDEKNVPGGASLTRMQEATDAYLSREVDRQFETFNSPKDMIKHSAEKLVRVRRARKKLGGPRWDYFIGEGLSERMAAQTAARAAAEEAVQAARMAAPLSG